MTTFKSSLLIITLAGVLSSSSYAGSVTRPTLPPTPCAKALLTYQTMTPVAFKKQVNVLQTVFKGCATEFVDQIVWEDGATGNHTIFSSWTTTQQNRLYAIFNLLQSGATNLGLQCPDPNTAAVWSNANPTAPSWPFLTAAQAFDVYAAHVAQALYLEITGALPWSLLALPTDELAEIFSSDRYHSRILAAQPAGSYPSFIQPLRDFQLPARARPFGDALNCDPRVGYNFLSGQNSINGNLIATTEEETLVNLTYWAQSALAHGDPTYDSTKSRLGMLLKDRLTAKPLYDYTPTGAIASQIGNGLLESGGCHTASNLLHDLARSLNIPLLVGNSMDIQQAGAPQAFEHGGLVFHWVRPNTLVLWHADDIYANGNNPSIASWNPATTSTLLGTDAKDAFLNAVWQSPTVLGAHYFNVSSSNNYAFSNDPNDNGLPNSMGRTLGYWVPTPLDTAASVYSGYRNLYQWLENYNVGGWQFLLSMYCNDLQYQGTFEEQLALDGALSSSMPPSQTSVPYPVNMTGDQFWNQAQAGVNAMASYPLVGCGAISDSFLPEFNNARATTGWVN